MWASRFEVSTLFHFFILLIVQEEPQAGMACPGSPFPSGKTETTLWGISGSRDLDVCSGGEGKFSLNPGSHWNSHSAVSGSGSVQCISPTVLACNTGELHTPSAHGLGAIPPPLLLSSIGCSGGSLAQTLYQGILEGVTGFHCHQEPCPKLAFVSPSVST